MQKELQRADCSIGSYGGAPKSIQAAG